MRKIMHKKGDLGVASLFVNPLSKLLAFLRAALLAI
jgi:hypothetical protein